MDNRILQRYQRQIILPGMGEAGQQKLLQAKVLVIGAGGLGCPILQYLAAAGVGTIGIIDHDVVELSNLHRQVLFSTNDIGLSKAKRAAEILKELNREISFISYNERLTNRNAWQIISAFDIIVDGSDNFPTRYLVNDACVSLRKILVYGAVSRFEGQVSVFNHKEKRSVNYRDLFPHPPKDGEILNCELSGVMGVLPGIIGAMMTNETIKLITGIGDTLAGQLLTYNSLTSEVYTLSLRPNHGNTELAPANEIAFLNMDYERACAPVTAGLEIDPLLFSEYVENGEIEIIDVREPGESPEITAFHSINIPLSKLEANLADLKSGTIIVVCQTGKRSLQAARILSGIFGGAKKVFSLRGGITEWNYNQSNEPKEA